MATHDYVLNNQNGALFRADINSALQAIVTNNSSPTAPVPTYPFMMWVDTTTGILKQRNAANTAWINIYNYASPGIIDAVNFHTGTLLTSWTNFTPTVSAGGGTFTSATAVGRFKQIGKTVHANIELNVVTNGTASGFVRLTLPVTASMAVLFSGTGRNRTTAQQLQVIADTSTAIVVQRFDGVYPVANNNNCTLSFTYEAA
jgi:hypothetical protein